MSPEATAPSRSKDTVVETIRGLSIVLVVVYHSVGAESALALQWLADAIDPIIMPMFAFVAGYVYSMRTVTWERVPRFILSKALRILVPFSIASLATYVLVGVLHGGVVWSEMWRPLLFSYEHFWFLQALFVMFLITAIVDAAGLLRGYRRWLGTTGSVWVVCFLVPGTDFFSLWGAKYLLPIFLVGYGVLRHPERVLSRHALVGWGLLLIGALTVFLLSKNDLLSVSTRRGDLTSMALGLALSILLLASRIRARSLVFVGAASYCIYLYHGFGVSLAAKLSRAAHIDENGYACFLSKSVLGLLLPVCLYLVLARMRFARKLILGQ